MKLTMALLALGLFAQPSLAQRPSKAPAANCYYVYSIDKVSHLPRRFEVRLRTVTAKQFAAMNKLTRESVMAPRYDKIWAGTDVATRLIRHAFVFGVPCDSFGTALYGLGFVFQFGERTRTKYQKYSPFPLQYKNVKVPKFLSLYNDADVEFNL
jgi:hypothetical protein